MSATRTVDRWLLPALAIVIFFGGIGIAQATGSFVTSGRTMGAAERPGGAGAGGGSGSGAAVAAGSLTPESVKGWMTVQQAADGLGMPVADVIALIAPPAGVVVGPETPLKELESLVPGFSLAELRARLQVRAPAGR
ncbi:MAG TPA: hypothetical protein P5181_05445 [Dermatophilaceae bacterium]|nr:hypothetical protein [Dermatophilaceae bacterium]